MATKIVGLLGKKRSGKDSLAALLVARHGFTRIALADPLRTMALGLNPLVGFDLEPGDHPILTRHVLLSDALAEHGGWEGVKTSPYADEVRRVLQRIGTEGVRDVFGPNAWVDLMMRRAAEVDGPVVVPDVRFPSEYDAILHADGTLVRLVGRGVVGDMHPSETALDDHQVHVTVNNAGPLDSLRFAADELAASI